MKYLFIIIFALAAFGCKNEKIEPQIGSLTCKINGTDWTGKIKPTNLGIKFGFRCEKMKVISGVEVPWQILGISNILKTSVSQQIHKINYQVSESEQDSTLSGLATTQDDGDVACDSYNVIEADSLTNFIKITKETGNYKEVWGEFSINFVRKYGCSESTLPDTLRIREGQFHVVLE